jgi:phosphoenolpyruvate phosphomutase
MSKAKKLRELFRREGVIRLVGAHDGLTARLVEFNGFDGVWASGLEVSASHAVPDANILTMTQYLEAATVMNSAISLPVVADCDTGYGNSNNVAHMVKKYEAAGIAAVTIEDKKFPKVNSYVPGRQELASVPEFVGKIKAGKNAQESDAFMVIARVEALIAGWGLEEALRRAHAYAEAGADAILIHSKQPDPSEIVEFARAWGGAAPLVIVPTTYPAITLDEVSRLGVKMVIYANHGLRASIKAINTVLSKIKTEGLHAIEDDIVPMSEVFRLQGMPEMKEQEKVFLRTEEEPIQVIILAAGAPRNQESLEPLLRDIPLACLDIKGKPLLQRNVETLHRCRLYRISVVRGYKKEQLNVEGVNYVDNPKYQSEHVLSSVMCAEGVMSGKTLVIYADILFEGSLIERLKQVEADFVIVVDNSFSKSLKRNKKLELVAMKEPLARGDRVLTYDRLYNVERMGCKLPEDEACAEFIGVALFSSKGTEILKREYRKALSEFRDKPLGEAPNVFQATLADFLQHLIGLGYGVKALQVNSGWMEIHTIDNYRYACSIV